MSIHSTYRFPFAAYPAVRLVLLLTAGITLDFHLDIQSGLWIGITAAMITAFILLDWVNRRTLKTRFYYGALTCYLLATIGFGGAWHALFNDQDTPPAATALNSYTWDELRFSGEVYRIKPTNTGKYQIDVKVDSTFFPDRLLWQETYKLRATLNPKDLTFPSKLGLGDRMQFSAVIYPLKAPTNPHLFNYKKYLASQGIYSQAGLQSIRSIRRQHSLFSWSRIRQHVLTAIDRNFSPQTAPLAKALLIGHKNELDRGMKTAFSRAGLSHIMAVSGLHVGFILAPFWIVIPFFWSSRNGRRLGLFILVVTLFFYAGLTGFSASVTRASLTGGLLAYARLYHKVRNAKNLTAVAALIILLLNPNDLFAIGFQLSFGAVYLILLISPVVNRVLPDRIRFRWYGTPVMVVIISLIVQVGLFPLLAYYFREFSLVGPIANALVVPFLGLTVPYALLLLPLTMLWPAVGHLLNIPVDLFLHQLGRFVTLTSGWEWSWMQVHIDGLLTFAIWIAAVFLIASLPIARLRWKILVIFLFILVIDQAQTIIQKMRPAKLELTVFDVGQGDATLISTPDNKHYLMDTGRWQPGYNSARYVIIPFLQAEGITKLNGVFLSHPHADHIGGMPELLNTIPIDTIYNSGSPYESALFSNYQALAAQKNTPIVSLRAGMQLELDRSTRLFVYSPEENGGLSSNVNNRSLVLEIIYGNTEFLFMGDAERAQEKRVIQQYPQLIDTDFLKVGHHGSKTSSTENLLRAASPDIGVTSLSLRNRFGHPNIEAIARLRQQSVDLYFTSIDGAVQLQSDGNEITVRE